jgi:type IV pilus assembly protein PilO
MAFQDLVQDLQEFDVNDLDFDNIGSWPLLVKIIVWLVVFIGGLTLGYIYDISDLQLAMESEQKQETTLKAEFERKAFQAANLQSYRKQMEEMKESFGALIGQLPSDTEVPGLLEDITNKGLENGLEIESITLGDELSEEFYIVLPIEIVVKGSYHDFGAFVSGIAGLPRIVTLHDFNILKKPSNTALTMQITAKTYRYKNIDEEGA